MFCLAALKNPPFPKGGLVILILIRLNYLNKLIHRKILNIFTFFVCRIIIRIIFIKFFHAIGAQSVAENRF